METKGVTVCSHSWAVLFACEVTRDGISLSPLLLQGFSPSSELLSHAQRSHPRTGSPMPCSGSQVKEMVMAKRVPHWTFSTRWRFSDPEVKNDTRPAKTKILTLNGVCHSAAALPTQLSCCLAPAVPQ